MCSIVAIQHIYSIQTHMTTPYQNNGQYFVVVIIIFRSFHFFLVFRINYEKKLSFIGHSKTLICYILIFGSLPSFNWLPPY